VYATLCLFRADAPAAETGAYLDQVVRAILPARPSVVYLAPADVGAALRRICDERGPALEGYWVRSAEGSRCGRRRRWRGFAGLVDFWSAHRRLTDGAFARLPFPKVRLDPTDGGRGATDPAVLDFLGLPPSEEVTLASADASRFAGTYVRQGVGGQERCVVAAEAESLSLSGLPGIWPRATLLPAWSPPGDSAPTVLGREAPATFHVEAWPIRVMFNPDGAGEIRAMTAGDHRWGRSERTFVRE
jgi:hypothetical protein